MSTRSTLVGDGIENPGNADVMAAAASMFDWDCAFHDRSGLEREWSASGRQPLATLTLDDLARDFRPIVALENVEGADSIYGFRAPPGPRLALVVGNERHGIAPDVLELAHRRIQIPLASRQINTINVAAASAVALYFITRGGGGKLRTRADPNRSRPELLLMAPTDAIEVGSAIRSAAAFGWNRLFLEDRRAVWFETDRVTRSFGRGAARRGRNSIRVIPAPGDRTYAFEEACVVSTRGGEPLHRVDLARGPEQLIVVADESGVAVAEEELGRLARKVRVLGLDLPRADFTYRFRLVASIALAEVARQVGLRQGPGRGRARPPVYDRTLRAVAEDSVGVDFELAALPL